MSSLYLGGGSMNPIPIAPASREWLLSRETLDPLYVAYLLLHPEPASIGVLPDNAVIGLNSGTWISKVFTPARGGILVPLPKMSAEMRDRYRGSLGWYLSIRYVISAEDLNACLAAFRETVNSAFVKGEET